LLLLYLLYSLYLSFSGKKTLVILCFVLILSIAFGVEKHHKGDKHHHHLCFNEDWAIACKDAITTLKMPAVTQMHSRPVCKAAYKWGCKKWV
jgi:hypothetical protein